MVLQWKYEMSDRGNNADVQPTARGKINDAKFVL